MAEAQKAPARPWTPTERPGDASYTSPVVFHGDHRVDANSDDSDSGVSWEDDHVPQSGLSAEGKDLVKNTTSKPQPLRFRSSYALRDDAAASAPETQVYQPYQYSQDSSVLKDDVPRALRPQRSAQALNVDRGHQLPLNNPYRSTLNFESPRRDDASATHTQASPEKEHDDTRLPPNNPYRLSQAMRSESTEGLLFKAQNAPQALPTKGPGDVLTEKRRLSQTPRTESTDPAAVTAIHHSASQAPQPASAASNRLPTSQSHAPSIKADDDLPSITGTANTPVSILLINPNSTPSMTTRCLESLAPTLPLNVTIYGFTAPRPAPTAIESQTDATMSTAACARAILPMATTGKYDAFLVACFSHHPLIAALREQVVQPVIGIMEASLYASRMCGSKFGIVTTGLRSSLLHDSSVKNIYGMGAFSVGTESTRLGVLELESRDREEVKERIAMAARRLQERGADCICMGCAGMTDLKEACQDAVGMHDRVAMVVDGVAMGVHFLVGLVRENLGTPKRAGYSLPSDRKPL